MSGAGLPTGTNNSPVVMSSDSVDQEPPPPVSADFLFCQVSAPGWSPVGIVSKRQTSRPVSTSNASTRPRTPQSEPAVAVKTRPFQPIGAPDRNSPSRESPTMFCQISAPLCASSASR